MMLFVIWYLTSSLSQPIISPKETCLQRQYVGSFGSIGALLRSGMGAGTKEFDDESLADLLPLPLL